MKAIEIDSHQMTKEFEQLVADALFKLEELEKLGAFEIHYGTILLDADSADFGHEYDCCTDDDCIKKAIKELKKECGDDIQFEESSYDYNEWDASYLHRCHFCGKRLRGWLTWVEDELEYLEEDRYSAEYLKTNIFEVYVILSSMPSNDYSISRYARHQKKMCHNSKPFEEACADKEEFFQRVVKLAQAVVDNL